MPLYDYLCEECGPFRAWQPMMHAMRPTLCPDCGHSAERAITAPHLRCGAAVIRYRAEAHNEKSAHEPMVVRRFKAGHGHAEQTHHGHRHGLPKQRKRPWMIGHS
jgi:putative FmdB family regulatory protein